ncbi:trans-sialidase, putative, partial [Trypanosoma cruzi marinkellei]
RHYFYSAVLLLLVVMMMMCHSIGAAAAEENKLKTTLFGKGDLFNDTENKNMLQAFDSFRAPSLVEVDGVVVAIVEAHYMNATDEQLYVGVAAKSMAVNEKKWREGRAIVFDHYDIKVYRLLSPTSIVDNVGIKALLGGYGKSGAPLTEVAGDGGYWTSRYASGQFFNGREYEEKKNFEWDQASTSEFFPDLFKGFSPNTEPYKQFLGGGGAGIQMDDGPYVLPIQALKHDGTKVSLVILAQRTNGGWEFSNGTSDDGCIQPAVLELEDKSLLMMTSCDDGSRRVYWSSSMGTWWYEEYGTLSRVWGNSRTRTGHGVQGSFVSATIDGQKVILVSQPVYSETDGKEETGRLHLWLTDMQRIYDVGPISAAGENVAASTLLYATVEVTLSEEEGPKEENKLYCSYEVAAAGEDNYNISFVDLTEKLKDMKKVLAVWKEKEAYIAREYSCGNERDNKNRSDCDSDLTKGLVGFLSNTSTGNTWSDEYLCVNATVHGEVTRTADGELTFKGPGAGAEWPVGKWGRMCRTTLRMTSSLSWRWCPCTRCRQQAAAAPFL